MSFKRNVLKARSHIVFILALLTAFGLVTYIERIDFENRVSARVNVKNDIELEVPEPRKLSDQEQEWARIAWRYFENNINAGTGLVNSVDKFPAATMWDTASYMMALISVQRLEIISKQSFETKMSSLLQSLAALELFESTLPNKVYNTQNLKMVNYQNRPSAIGIGWSAIDVGRIMVPLNILVWNYPEFTPKVRAVIEHWQLKAMIRDGNMYGAVREKGQTQYLQEGRLGYEEYAAKSMQLMGFDVSEALDYQAWINFVRIYGINIATDSRRPEEFTAHNYVVSEPYILDGLEYGWDQISQQFSNRVYKVQEARFKDTGILTAVSEDNIDEAPYFVYNTVFTGGKTWNAITEDGTDASKYKSLSTKAAFGWHALYETDYTQQLVDAVSTLYDAEKGWYSGLYERNNEPNKALTANTNGIILESLAYKALGPLLKPGNSSDVDRAVIAQDNKPADTAKQIAEANIATQ